MFYRCQFPGCEFSTEIRTQIHRHHIIPREHKGSNQEYNRISLCPGHHTKIYIPNATRGMHANKGVDSIILLGWKDSTRGKVLHYIENDECVGLGDFLLLRCRDAFFFCQKNGIEFDVTFQLHSLKKYLEIKQEYIVPSNVSFYNEANDRDYEKILNSKTDLFFASRGDKKFLKYYKIRHNNYSPAMYLTPNEIVKQKVHEELQRLNIQTQKYISIHLRFGDNHMKEKRHERIAGLVGCDDRIQDIEKVKKKIAYLKEKVSLPIVLHSDNQILRDLLAKELKLLQLDIPNPKHTGTIVTNDPDILDVLVELEIMKNSSSIYYEQSSCFSKLASDLGKVPYVSLRHRSLKL